MQVKEYRLMKKYTQKYMADKLEITQEAYSHKENGKRGFTVQELFMLEEILDTSINELFKDIKNKAKKKIEGE